MLILEASAEWNGMEGHKVPSQERVCALKVISEGRLNEGSAAVTQA